jgi:gliding motility-associated-like protein
MKLNIEISSLISKVLLEDGMQFENFIQENQKMPDAEMNFFRNTLLPAKKLVLLSSALLVVFSTLQLSAQGQIVLDRQVVSCIGINLCADDCISSTGGQVDYLGCTNGEYDLTSGFEQPDGPLSMSVSLQVIFDECTSSYEAEIISVSNCNGSDSLIYLWNGLEGDVTAENLGATFSLQVLSDAGCEYYAEFDASLMDVESVPCELQFFSFLSPNNDGDNDIWQIGNITQDSFSVNKVQLFNRWGNVVWETQGYDNSDRVWKGENTAGEPLPDGTYFYYVEVNGKKFNGYVELMR